MTSRKLEMTWPEKSLHKIVDIMLCVQLLHRIGSIKSLLFTNCCICRVKPSNHINVLFNRIFQGNEYMCSTAITTMYFISILTNFWHNMYNTGPVLMLHFRYYCFQYLQQQQHFYKSLRIQACSLRSSTMNTVPCLPDPVFLNIFFSSDQIWSIAGSLAYCMKFLYSIGLPLVIKLKRITALH